MRFARDVQFQIKNGKEKEFTTLIENEVIPTLKKQPGFEQELRAGVDARQQGRLARHQRLGRSQERRGRSDLDVSGHSSSAEACTRPLHSEAPQGPLLFCAER